MPLEQLFFGCRDLNQFLKGKRQLEYEQTVEYPKQNIFCGARDLNKFLKGSRLLEFDQVQPNQRMQKVGLRKNMHFCISCFIPFLLTLASIERLYFAFFVIFILTETPFVLWIIAKIIFFVAMFFIWFNSNYYRFIILIFLIQWILDLVAFMVLLTESLQYEYQMCFDNYSDEQTCETFQWEMNIFWFLIYILPTLVVYFCLIILVWQVYKYRPNPESQYIKQQETNISNIP